MIAVNVSENSRTFEVKVGDKLVGQVEVYPGSGRVQAYAKNPAPSPQKYRWIEGGFKSITQATNYILLNAGYGRCTGINLERCCGFRKK